MGIEFQKYRPWKGTRLSTIERVAALVKKETFLALKSKWVIALVVLTYFFGVITRMMTIVFTPTKFDAEFFQGFFNDGELWFILMAAVVGSGLIADDLRNNSIVLYFSRLPRSAYAAGKFGVVAAVLSITVILPGILLFFMALLSSSESLGHLLDHMWILGAIVAAGVLIIALMGSISLAISSITSDKRYAGAGIFMVFLLSDIVAGVMENIMGYERLAMISLWNNIKAVSMHLFGMENFYDFPWYESLLIIAVVITCSTGIIYFKLFRKEVRV